MSDTILAIDNGTQSVRALLFDRNGELLAKAKVEIEPYFSVHPGWAEQEPEIYWQALVDACSALWGEMANLGLNKADIAGVSVTTQRGTMVNLDKGGKPLRPAITWLDQRNSKALGHLPKLHELAFKMAGAKDLVERYQARAQYLWIASNQPDIWEKTDKYLNLSGFLNYRLCGDFVDSLASQVAYLPFDYKGLKWSAESDWRYRLLPGFKQELFPKLYRPATVMGQVTVDAQNMTGIPAGVPLIASASDKACEILGSGGQSDDVACMSYGTTATINTTSKKYIEPIRFMPAYPSAIPDHYCSEIMIFRGFWMVSWFKNEFGLREQAMAEAQNVSPESLFDELVNAVPPGSMGLMLQPYWTPGVRDPGPEAKGGIIGFGDVHTRAHVYRAILEGLAYGLREGMERLEKRNKQKIKLLRVSGGGSQSDAALQLTADIFGLPVERPHTYETSGLGAAMDVAVALGWYSDCHTAIAGMTRVGKRFEPTHETHITYNRLYNEVYLNMYKQLRPLYRSIQDITGYPEKS
ncbi:FGGY-family carbohydrate kinase [Oleiphilus sp. HI0125]|uniref:FGGY-family carbohydrate kinase n=1 Tax=Oleiphilus sp. HI0125 TaxID=1822266 RepID=UPI0009EEFB72|nr:FGGY-family carbohydrate kinase [Oleiphilus sp. HI0125]